jgi:hypothetical protein
VTAGEADTETATDVEDKGVADGADADATADSEPEASAGGWGPAKEFA